MKSKLFYSAGLIVLAFFTLQISLTAAKPDQRVTDSRLVIKQFFGELKNELMSAMKKGGPTTAISVCEEKAPEIAERISKEKGWMVSRTSLKFRNTNNQPDAWEKKVLETFEKRKLKGESVDQLEFSEVVESKGKKMFRYMRAIPTQKPCLTCHGASIDPKIVSKLNTIYPDDLAKGFKEGDIRGAFSIIQPIR